MLRKLRDFMAMKSIMIQAKRNPKLMSDPQFLVRAMDYLKTNTEFTQQPFWANLSKQLQDKAAQYFVMQEVSQPVMTRMLATKDNAAVFVVLSGSAEIIGSNGNAQVLGPGELFGAMDLFQEVLGNMAKYSNVAGDALLNDHIMSTKMNAGSFLRISLTDICEYVFGHGGAEKINIEQFSEISGLNWDDMTDDDKFYVKVYLRTRELINKKFFTFLDSYRLIPKNSRMSAFRYFNERERGKKIVLNKNDPMEVIVVIDGCVKLEIDAKRKGFNRDNKVSCQRKGRKSMVIKVSTTSNFVGCLRAFEIVYCCFDFLTDINYAHYSVQFRLYHFHKT
jgi:hypothetical protein